MILFLCLFFLFFDEISTLIRMPMIRVEFMELNNKLREEYLSDFSWKFLLK